MLIFDLTDKLSKLLVSLGYKSARLELEDSYNSTCESTAASSQVWRLQELTERFFFKPVSFYLFFFFRYDYCD